MGNSRRLEDRAFRGWKCQQLFNSRRNSTRQFSVTRWPGQSVYFAVSINQTCPITSFVFYINVDCHLLFDCFQNCIFEQIMSTRQQRHSFTKFFFPIPRQFFFKLLLNKFQTGISEWFGKKCHHRFQEFFYTFFYFYFLHLNNKLTNPQRRMSPLQRVDCNVVCCFMSNVLPRVSVAQQTPVLKENKVTVVDK